MVDLIDDTDVEAPRCVACAELLKDGDEVYNERDGGCIHAACCGDDPESFYGDDDEPLKPGDPIPSPWKWTSEPAPAVSNGEQK